MKKHIPFLLIFYLCLVLAALLAYVYTDSRKAVDEAKQFFSDELTDTYYEGFVDGAVFASQEYEDAASQVKALEVSEISGFDLLRIPRTPGFSYSPLDDLNRPGPAYALIDPSQLPAAPASSLKEKDPVGYQPLKFDFISSGGWLYNRTHLIGSLLGGDSEIYNIVTCTQYLNQVLMYPLESQVYSYLVSRQGPVQFAVIPSYLRDEVLPRGLYFYAASINDDSIRICEFLPNVQPGIDINYTDGTAQETPHY